MAAGLQAKVIKPHRLRCALLLRLAGLSNAVAVHRAVQVYPGDAVAMGLDNGFYYGGILDIRGAFVVNDYVEALRVIRIVENWQRWFCALVVRVGLLDDEVGSLFQTSLENVL